MCGSQCVPFVITHCTSLDLRDLRVAEHLFVEPGFEHSRLRDQKAINFFVITGFEHSHLRETKGDHPTWHLPKALGTPLAPAGHYRPRQHD